MPADSPEQCEELYARYINTRNVNSALALYEPEASHIRRDGGITRGHYALRRLLDDLAATQPRMSIHVSKVVRAGEDLAVVYDEWSLFATGLDGNTIASRGRGVHVLRRQATGEWLYSVTGVTNNNW